MGQGLGGRSSGASRMLRRKPSDQKLRVDEESATRPRGHAWARRVEKITRPKMALLTGKMENVTLQTI